LFLLSSADDCFQLKWYIFFTDEFIPQLKVWYSKGCTLSPRRRRRRRTMGI